MRRFRVRHVRQPINWRRLWRRPNAWVLGVELALTTTTPAHALPVTVIATALEVSANSFIAIAVTAIINVAISVVVSVLINAAYGPNQTRQAQITTLAVGESPRVAIFGETGVGGTLCDAFNWGGTYGTDWECQIIALADHRCDSLVSFYVNDQLINYPVGGFPGGIVPDQYVSGTQVIAGQTVTSSAYIQYNGQLQVWFLDGSAGQALPDVVTNGGWSSTGNFDGITLAVVAYKADDPSASNPVWSGGRPNFVWRVRGKRCYDPRYDSSVGGSGTQRWTDPTTWVWTNNASVCRYNWVRGVYAKDQVGDPGSLLIGRGLTSLEAPEANVFAYANICDEAVPLASGGAEPRYCVNGAVMSNEKFVDVEKMFADAMGGIIIQPGGSVEVEPGHARTITFEITDDELITGSQVQASPFRSVADSAWVNTVIPRYTEPTQRFQEHGAPLRRVAADVTADGMAREVTLTLNQVTSGTQAQRLGEIQRKLGRYVRTAKITLGPRFNGIEEGDWGTWTSTRHWQGETVVFRVEAYSIDNKRQITLMLREIDSSVYDWNAATDEIASDVADVPVIPVGGYYQGNYIAPTGNRVPFSQFENGTASWGIIASGLNITATAAVQTDSSGVHLGTSYTSTAAAAGQAFQVGMSNASFAVPPGEGLAVQMCCSATGPLSNAQVFIRYLGSGGASLNADQLIGTVAATGTWAWAQAFVVVPQNAARALLYCQSNVSGAGSGTVMVRMPCVTPVAPGQVAFPPFTPGPNAHDGADVTGSNTSNDTSHVSGTPSSTVISNLTAAQSATAALTTAMSAANANIAMVQNAAAAAQTSANSAISTATNALSAANTASSNLTAEISRAEGVEGTLSTSIANLTTTVTANNNTLTSSISSEALTRAAADSALNGLITSLTSTVTTNNSTQSANLTSEVGTRAAADSALSASITTLTSNYNSLNSTVSNNYTTLSNANSATASAVTLLASSLAGSGNRIPFSQFENGLATWGITYAYSSLTGVTASITNDNAGPAISASATAPSSAIGQGYAVGEMNNYFWVNAGERIAVQLLGAYSGAGAGTLTPFVRFFNATGTIITPDQQIGTIPNTGAWTQLQTFMTVPSGAVSAMIYANFNIAAAGATGGWIRKPMVSSATATQTAFPAFAPGPNAYNGADVTATSAAMSSEAATRAAADSALSASITTLTSNYNSLSSTISSNYSTLSNANSATSSALTTLQAFATPNPNLLINPTGTLGLTGWNTGAPVEMVSYLGIYGEGYMFVAAGGSNSAQVAYYQDYNCNPYVTFSLQAWIYTGGISVTSGYAQARVYIEWLNSADSHIGYSAVAAANAGSAWTFVQAQSQIAPAGTAKARVWMDIWGSGTWTNNNAAWKQLKLESGVVCTQYTDNASAASLQGSINTIQSITTTLTGQVYGTYGLTVNANGAIAGMTLYASGGAVKQSSVVFDANSFIIKSSANPNIMPFSYDSTSGTLFLNSITVNTLNVANNAITTLAAASNGAVSNATSSTQTVTSFTVNMAYAGSALIQLTAKINNNNPLSGQTTWTGNLVVDSTTTQTASGSLYTNGSVNSNNFPMAVIANLSAGNHTIAFSWSSSNNQLSIPAGGAVLSVFSRYK